MVTGLKTLYKLFSPKYQKLILEYKVDLRPRYHEVSKPHKLLNEIIGKQNESYQKWIDEIINNKEIFYTIKKNDINKDTNNPTWNNGFLPGLDMITLYTIVKKLSPKKYIEIGSGHSTKVARKSINDNSLNTLITSIDPFPRANIDSISNEVIRKPFELISNYDFITHGLEKNDILFIDNSHRCLPNSDVTVFFMEILPYLQKGVIVHIHDIYLPFDYPQFMCDRFYSEQYVLAAFLLANPLKFKPIFPCYYVSKNTTMSNRLEVVWNSENTKGVEKHGGSFWFEIN